MDTEQIMESQPQVPENPHAEYGLAENVEQIAENEKTSAEKTSKQKINATTTVRRAGGMAFSCVHEVEVINHQTRHVSVSHLWVSEGDSHLNGVALLQVAFAMDEAIVYADISISAEASPPKDLPSVQHSDHRPCKRWHWIMLWVGLAGNIILVAAVIAMGVWGRNKNKERLGASISSSEHINGHQYGHTEGEGNRTLEDFKSRLKEDLCVNSTESGSCRLCPLMWQKNEDRCYWFSTSTQSWEKSHEDCTAKRSQLLMDSDQEFIQKNLQAPVWIGLHLEPTKKKWVWLNGSLLNQTQYQAFPLEKHCGTLTKNKIDHEQCSQLLHWICQKKSVLI